MYMFSMRKSMHVLGGVVVLTGAILFSVCVALYSRMPPYCHSLPCMVVGGNWLDGSLIDAFSLLQPPPVEILSNLRHPRQLLVEGIRGHNVYQKLNKTCHILTCFISLRTGVSSTWLRTSGNTMFGATIFCRPSTGGWSGERDAMRRRMWCQCRTIFIYFGGYMPRCRLFTPLVSSTRL